MAPLPIVSSSLLAAPGAFQPLFSPLPTVRDTLIFDEGPRQPNTKTQVTSSLSGAINTSAVDAYAQGVEITRLSQYDAGLAKIWSGEPGHQLRPAVFGQENETFSPARSFSDQDHIVSTQIVHDNSRFKNTITFPIVNDYLVKRGNFVFNGIIEPLAIRPRVAFVNARVPFEAHQTSGAVMGGNEDDTSSSEQVTIVDYVNMYWSTGSHLRVSDRFPKQSVVPFVDITTTSIKSSSLAPLGFFAAGPARDPFLDQRLVGNMVYSASIVTTNMYQSVSLMSGSTENYVAWNKRSATCGFVFDNVAGVGTDSLAFGGRTF